MSAVSIIQSRPDTIYLVTDGAAYDREGRVTGVAGKVHLLSSLSAAMVGTGRSVDASYIASQIERRASDFDDLKGNAPELVEQIAWEAEKTFGEDDHGLGSRLVFAGWSEKRRRCEGFGIATFASPTNAAFTVIEIEGGMMSPVLSEAEFINGFGRRPTMEDMADIDYAALTILELQRRTPFTGDLQFLVGGIAELVTVRRNHVESRVLKRWPDEIGELIEPEPIDWARMAQDARAGSNGRGQRRGAIPPAAGAGVEEGPQGHAAQMIA